MKYAVVVEQGSSSYGVSVPDLPGCVVAGETREEALRLVKEAIEFHVEGLREDGEDVPEPRFEVEHIEVDAA